MPDGGFGAPPLRPSRQPGAVFLGHDSGVSADRGRAVGHRRADRPRHLPPTPPRPPCGRRPAERAESIYELLNARLAALARAERVRHPAELTRDLHIQPDFHGNRSPRADPTLKGTMAGLPLSATADDLARQYLAAIQAVAYGTRHILAEMNRRGYRIDTLLACGGGTKNPVFLREHADITGCRIVLPRGARRRCCSAPPCSARWPPAGTARCWPRWGR